MIKYIKEKALDPSGSAKINYILLFVGLVVGLIANITYAHLNKDIQPYDNVSVHSTEFVNDGIHSTIGFKKRGCDYLGMFASHISPEGKTSQLGWEPEEYKGNREPGEHETQISIFSDNGGFPTEGIVNLLTVHYCSNDDVGLASGPNQAPNITEIIEEDNGEFITKVFVSYYLGKQNNPL